MIPQKRTRELSVKTTVRTESQTISPVDTLIDSGCTHTCISKKLVEREGIPTKKMKNPVNVFNADGTKNKDGQITDYVNLEVELNGHKENIEATVVQLEDRADIFMGHDWLIKHNPEIDWNNGKVKFTRCPPDCSIEHQDIPFSPQIRRLVPQDNLWEEEDEPDPTNPEDLPDYARPFIHLFNKKTFDKLPERTEWDHEINLTSEAPGDLGAGTYNMTVKEQEELKEFVKENLESGRIRPSKSPYTAPVFFIPKKDGSKRLVQDY
jgi:hypothetical protein